MDLAVTREIKEGPDFAACVEKIGGYRAIDTALEPLLDGLYRDPFGFPTIETEFTVLARFCKTKAIADIIPALVFVFRIDDNKDVILEWVEEDLSF